MKNRVAFLLWLDSAMLLLVVVLECINFTGLQWHQWLGFAFCPVVLLHVVLQWQWFITQFQRVLAPGAWRVRVNAGLNLLLLWLMAAVLFSGVFVSSQAVEALGERFGQVPIWSEVHGWLNVALVAAVGLHLGLNWDWVTASLRRCLRTAAITATDTSLSPGSAAVPAASSGGVSPLGPGARSLCSGEKHEARRLVNSQARTPALPAGHQQVGFVRSLGRAVAVLLVATAGAGAAYFVFDAMLPAGKRAAMQHQRAAARAKGLPPNLYPRHRAISLRKALDLARTLALTMFVAVIGRYVFRLLL